MPYSGDERSSSPDALRTSGTNIGRIILAFSAGYLFNGLLVALSEMALSRLIPSSHSSPPLSYFVIDLLTQCLYTIIAGYLCCLIATPCNPAAMMGLAALGILVGSISLASSWRSEPHWYGAVLLAVFPLCVWIGWKIRKRISGRAQRA
jgi:hypothetical protein